MLQLREPQGQNPERRQERADLVDKENSHVIRQFAQDGRTNPGSAECDAEEEAGNQADASRHNLLSVNDDGRKC